MKVTLPVPGDRESISAALEGLTALDQRIIRAHPEVPRVYDAGVRWLPEPAGSERWRNIADILGFVPAVTGKVERFPTAGAVDCEDLAAWACADRRERDHEPGARVEVIPGGRGVWHAIVRRADGSIEDPSARLGMAGPARQGQGVGTVAGNIEWEIRPLRGGGYSGSITIPGIRIGRGEDGTITIQATGETAAEAVARTAALAGLSTSHPAIRGMMDGAVPSKVSAIGRVARLARVRGRVLAGAARHLSPGLRALAAGICG